MPKAPLPLNEGDRLKVLNDLEILDTVPESSFDIVTRLACDLLKVPIALVSLLDFNRQWFKSCIGLTASETSRDVAFCAHAILSDDLLVVADATRDERFSDNPLVLEAPFIRFYLGIPLKVEEQLIGTLCVISPEPRTVTEDELRGIKGLAKLLEDKFALILALKRQKAGYSRRLQTEKLASIGALAAGVAHEINTPMQFVASNTEFIEAGFNGLKTLLDYYRNLVGRLDPSARPLHECEEVRAMEADLDLDFMLREIPLAVSQTKDGISRVTHMVEAMRDFTHGSTSGKRPEQINDLIRTTVVLTRNAWKYVSELELDLALDLPQVECSASEINQVILNLIVNAAHAIEERKELGWDGQGIIQLRTFQNNEEIVLEVTDNGIGIQPKVLPRIFDPFFTTKEVGKGTGQGLGICYDIVVYRHGGTLDVKSPVGARRTTFSVNLPIKSSEKDVPDLPAFTV